MNYNHTSTFDNNLLKRFTMWGANMRKLWHALEMTDDNTCFTPAMVHAPVQQYDCSASTGQFIQVRQYMLPHFLTYVHLLIHLWGLCIFKNWALNGNNFEAALRIGLLSTPDGNLIVCF